METKTIILAVLLLPLIQTYEDTKNPQSYKFVGSTPEKSYIEERLGCLPPNKTAIMYSVSFESDSSILYYLCYDKNSNIPLQSMHKLSPPVSGNINTYYSSDKFTNDLIASPSQFYECSYQENNFKQLLISANLINCKPKVTLEFAPSNLVPALDFPFEQQRRATEYYINTFPQWTYIKDGNWKNLEESIRKYVNNKGHFFVILGGTLGVTTLPNSRGQEQPVYMTRSNTNNLTVAVPRVVWKLVYDQHEAESIVFVSVNNPYRNSTQDLFKNKEVFCNCVCDQTEGWFDGWDRKNFILGYIYCCTWKEFHKNVGIELEPIKTALMRKKK